MFSPTLPAAGQLATWQLLVANPLFPACRHTVTVAMACRLLLPTLLSVLHARRAQLAALPPADALRAAASLALLHTHFWSVGDQVTRDVLLALAAPAASVLLEVRPAEDHVLAAGAVTGGSRPHVAARGEPGACRSGAAQRIGWL